MEIDGERYAKCPSGAVDRRLAGEAFSLHAHYRRGFLPGAGGVNDQLERELALIETVSAALAEIAAEKAERSG